MDVQKYRRRLLELDTQLSGRIARERGAAREQALSGTPGDIGDASVADESGSESFTEAEADATVLQQVKDALGRIDAGTFGQCVVDGGSIEEKRLDAVPWAPYCLKHQEEREGASPLKTPTL